MGATTVVRTPALGLLLVALCLGALPGARPPPARAQASGSADLASRAQSIMNEGLETCLVLVADTSGSMRNAPAGGTGGTGGPAKIGIARDALAQFAGAVPETVQMGMITFAGCRAQWVAKLGESSRAAILDRVAALEARGSTPIVGSLTLAHEALKERRARNPYGRYVIVLVTDGEETCAAPSLLPEVSARIAESAVELHVIGFDLPSEDTPLRGIGAKYYQASDSTQLREGLSTVQGELEVDAKVDTLGGGP
jgi:Ca-activated chloride channel family protein